MSRHIQRCSLLQHFPYRPFDANASPAQLPAAALPHMACGGESRVTVTCEKVCKGMRLEEEVVVVVGGGCVTMNNATT